MKLFAFLLAAAASLTAPFASAQAAPKKSAFIVVNWAAPAFVTEAKAVEAQFKRLGWDTYLFDQVESDDFTIQFTIAGHEQKYVCVKPYCYWEKIITGFLPIDSVKAGDQVLIDIEGDGTTVLAADSKLADGKSLGFDGLLLDIDTALSFEELSASFEYPIGNTDVLATHSVEAYFQNAKKFQTLSDSMMSKWGTGDLNMISTGDTLDLAKEYSAQGAKVTVMDNSCQGGTTVRLLETLKDHNVCAISSTGIDSPAIQGTPSVGDYLKKLNSSDHPKMSHLADFISDYFYSGAHLVGNRIHQAGFTNGCTQTMAIRELADNAFGAYSTWWDWNQGRPSYVVRQPNYFSVVAQAKPTDVWKSSDIDAAHAADCAASHKNCDPKHNPRQAIADGWVRWFAQSASELKNQPGIGAGLSHDQAAADFDKIQLSSQALLNTVRAYGGLLQELDDSLTFADNESAFYGSPKVSADKYLRTVLIERCLCSDKDTVKNFKLSCPSNGSDRYPVPAGFDAGSVCKDPFPFSQSVLGTISAKKDSHGKVIRAPLEILSQLHEYDISIDPLAPLNAPLIKGLIQVGLDLQPFEKSCVSDACKNQEF